MTCFASKDTPIVPAFTVYLCNECNKYLETEKRTSFYPRKEDALDYDNTHPRCCICGIIIDNEGVHTCRHIAIMFENGSSARHVMHIIKDKNCVSGLAPEWKPPEEELDADE